jgi:hypothetical protein
MMNFLFNYIFFLIFAFSLNQEIIYSCINCNLTEWAPFGKYKVAVFLNPADANRSKLILMNDQNLGIDTVSGFLQGFEKIIKTSNSTFTVVGHTSLKGKIENNQLKLDSVFTIKHVDRIKTINYEFPTKVLADGKVAWIELIRYQGGKNQTQLFEIQISLLQGRFDGVMASNRYYGGEIDRSHMFLLSGKFKNNPPLFPLSESYFGSHSDPVAIFEPGEGYIFFKRNSQEFYYLNRKIKTIPTSIFLESMEIVKPYIDFQSQKKYVVVKPKNELNYQLWVVESFTVEKWKVIGKINQMPYLIEGGKLFYKKETSLGVTILTEML